MRLAQWLQPLGDRKVRKSAGRLHPLQHRVWYLGAALLTSACSTSEPPTLPQLSEGSFAKTETSMASQPVGPPVGVGSVAADRSGVGQITAFRVAAVVLFTSDAGVDGQKVPAHSMAVPLPVVARSGSRLAIRTVEGVRWIAISDVAYDGNGSPEHGKAKH